jgi:hypothetical protein
VKDNISPYLGVIVWVVLLFAGCCSVVVLVNDTRKLPGPPVKVCPDCPDCPDCPLSPVTPWVPDCCQEPSPEAVKGCGCSPRCTCDRGCGCRT